MTETSVLGIVQGLTEFLPVSSSGHLGLFQIFMGWKENSLSFDIILHFSTMIATVIYFRRQIREIISEWFMGLFYSEARIKEGWHMGWAVIAGNCVTLPVALLLKPYVEKWIFSPLAIGTALMVTAGVLWYATFIKKEDKKVTLRRSLFIGFIQGLAVIPGISRSGVTIVTALRSGVSPERAFSFSFLLSLPAILGASVLEITGMSSISSLSSPLPSGWVWGAALAFLSGYLALGILHRIVTMGRWTVFSVYCALLGSASILVGVFPGVLS